jgi:hypothetical protein
LVLFSDGRDYEGALTQRERNASMMTVERHIGKHVFAVYDDIVLGTLDGTFCVEDARQYVELLSEIVRKLPSDRISAPLRQLPITPQRC